MAYVRLSGVLIPRPSKYFKLFTIGPRLEIWVFVNCGKFSSDGDGSV